MTSMYDGWSSSLEHLTARRFLSQHRDGRRCWHCDGDGACNMLTWALDYLGLPARSVPGQAAAILLRGAIPDGPPPGFGRAE